MSIEMLKIVCTSVWREFEKKKSVIAFQFHFNLSFFNEERERGKLRYPASRTIAVCALVDWGTTIFSYCVNRCRLYRRRRRSFHSSQGPHCLLMMAVAIRLVSQWRWWHARFFSYSVVGRYCCLSICVFVWVDFLLFTLCCLSVCHSLPTASLADQSDWWQQCFLSLHVCVCY